MMTKIFQNIAKFPYTPALMMIGLGLLCVLILRDSPEFAFSLDRIGLGSGEAGVQAEKWPAGWLLVLVGLVLYVVQFLDERKRKKNAPDVATRGWGANDEELKQSRRLVGYSLIALVLVSTIFTLLLI